MLSSFDEAFSSISYYFDSYVECRPVQYKKCVTVLLEANPEFLCNSVYSVALPIKHRDINYVMLYHVVKGVDGLNTGQKVYAT